MPATIKSLLFSFRKRVLQEMKENCNLPAGNRERAYRTLRDEALDPQAVLEILSQ